MLGAYDGKLPRVASEDDDVQHVEAVDDVQPTTDQSSISSGEQKQQHDEQITTKTSDEELISNKPQRQG